MSTETVKEETKKGTVMIRVTTQVREVLKKLAQPNETTDAVLRRTLGMEEVVDEMGLVKSLGEWPFKRLEINEHVIIPWPINPDTRLADEKRTERIRRAVYRYQRSTSFVYHMQGTPVGLKIQRIR